MNKQTRRWLDLQTLVPEISMQQRLLADWVAELSAHVNELPAPEFAPMRREVAALNERFDAYVTRIERLEDMPR